MDLKKKALIVGIDAYKHPLYELMGCVYDAQRMYEVLSKHNDEEESPNFDCKLLTSKTDEITRSELRAQIENLFIHKADVALFYFAGHGTIDRLGGYLATQDYERYDPGISMADVLSLANESKIEDVIIIIDCCHSGALGNLPNLRNEHAVLREGVSVLTASRGSEQASEETDGGGIFTSLVYEAFKGSAADLLGQVTVASVYAYVDQILGAWDQRPMFKLNTSRLITLRKCKPDIQRPILRYLPKYFKTPDYEYPIDKSYEPTEEPRNRKNERIFGHLQKFRAARLLVPVGVDHMYDAAVNEKSCKLTPLGQFYWRLAKEGKI
ncbi:caspase family protein [candidate division KSB1 bacterium]|nr:caspase family protein [candidate division KSB1 bacterium]